MDARVFADERQREQRRDDRGDGQRRDDRKTSRPGIDEGKDGGGDDQTDREKNGVIDAAQRLDQDAGGDANGEFSLAPLDEQMQRPEGEGKPFHRLELDLRHVNEAVGQKGVDDARGNRGPHPSGQVPRQQIHRKARRRERKEEHGVERERRRSVQPENGTKNRQVAEQRL